MVDTGVLGDCSVGTNILHGGKVTMNKITDLKQGDCIRFDLAKNPECLPAVYGFGTVEKVYPNGIMMQLERPDRKRVVILEEGECQGGECLTCLNRFFCDGEKKG